MGIFSDGLPERRGGWLKLKEGENRIRIASAGAVMADHYETGTCYGKAKGCKGCAMGKEPTFRKLFWVFDRTKVKYVEDGKEYEREAGLKLAKLGSVILKQLDAFAENQDYKFTEWPMPYDITIKAVGAGDKSVKYTVMPSPNRTPLTQEEQEALAKEHKPEEIVKAMKKKQAKSEGNYVPEPGEDTGGASSGIQYPQDDINPDDIPF